MAISFYEDYLTGYACAKCALKRPSQNSTMCCTTHVMLKWRCGGTNITGAIPQTYALPDDAKRARLRRRLKSDLRLDTSALIAGALKEQLCSGLSKKKNTQKMPQYGFKYYFLSQICRQVSISVDWHLVEFDKAVLRFLHYFGCSESQKSLIGN